MPTNSHWVKTIYPELVKGVIEQAANKTELAHLSAGEREQMIALMVQRGVMRLEALCLKQQAEEETVEVVAETKEYQAPATWWQHFKYQHRRWLPRWYLRRRPVVFTTWWRVPVQKTIIRRSATHLCPHLKTESTQHHLAFLYAGPESHFLGEERREALRYIRREEDACGPRYCIYQHHVSAAVWQELLLPPRGGRRQMTNWTAYGEQLSYATEEEAVTALIAARRRAQETK